MNVDTLHGNNTSDRQVQIYKIMFHARANICGRTYSDSALDLRQLSSGESSSRSDAHAGRRVVKDEGDEQLRGVAPQRHQPQRVLLEVCTVADGGGLRQLLRRLLRWERRAGAPAVLRPLKS
jgi:hypothetical protein